MATCAKYTASVFIHYLPKSRLRSASCSMCEAMLSQLITLNLNVYCIVIFSQYGMHILLPIPLSIPPIPLDPCTASLVLPIYNTLYSSFFPSLKKIYTAVFSFGPSTSAVSQRWLGSPVCSKHVVLSRPSYSICASRNIIMAQFFYLWRNQRVECY